MKWKSGVKSGAKWGRVMPSLAMSTAVTQYISITNLIGTSNRGVEWSGVELKEVEWSVVEYCRVEWSGVEWSGVKYSRVQ